MGKKRSTVHEYKVSNRPFNVEQKPDESDMHYYRRLAKVADQRLVRLEELSKQPGYKGVKNYAYKKAIYDAKTYGAKGTKPRFNIALERDQAGKIIEQRFKEKIETMKQFLESPTSTKYGIQEVYKKRTQTINERYGTNFTWQQLADYFNKGYDQKVSKRVGGSKTALYAIGKIQQKESNIVSAIETNTSIKTEDPVTDAAVDLLRSRLKIPGVTYDTDKRRQLRKAMTT